MMVIVAVEALGNNMDIGPHACDSLAYYFLCDDLSPSLDIMECVHVSARHFSSHRHQFTHLWSCSISSFGHGSKVLFTYLVK